MKVAKSVTFYKNVTPNVTLNVTPVFNVYASFRAKV